MDLTCLICDKPNKNWRNVIWSSFPVKWSTGYLYYPTCSASCFADLEYIKSFRHQYSLQKQSEFQLFQKIKNKIQTKGESYGIKHIKRSVSEALNYD